VIKFGSVFRYRELCYVYLGQTEDIIYAARILDGVHTKRLAELSEKRAKETHHRTNDGAMFCFVILKTDELREQAAYLNQTENETDLTIEPYMDLCDEDINDLKTKILEDGAIPSKLKEIVAETFA
jgi:hypothetical protein